MATESSAILLADERGKYIGYYGTNTNEFYTQSGKRSHSLSPSGHENKMHKERVNAFLRRLKQGGTDEIESPDDDRREALLDGDGEDRLHAEAADVGRERTSS